MSRWEIARETIAGVLKGRENEFSLKEETPTYARVFFRMAYWRETDYSDTVKALNKEGFAVVGWTIHGGGEGLNVELLLVGGPERAENREEEPKTVGWWKDPEALKRYVHLTSDQARELIEEMEKKDPERAELLKRKLLTGLVEG